MNMEIDVKPRCAPEKGSRTARLAVGWTRHGLVVIFVLMCTALAMLSPHFLTFDNIRNVLRQSSILFLVAAGQTAVLLTGGIDLSQGSVISLVSILTAMGLIRLGLIGGIVAGLAAGTCCGLISGLLVGKLKLLPFIATLGMMYVAEGMALIANNGQPVSNIPSDTVGRFFWLGGGYVGWVPVPLILAAVAFALLYLFFRYTRTGRYIYAVGGNVEAARLSGIDVSAVQVIVFSLSGFLTSVASVSLTARIISGQPMLGGDFLMQSLGAVVIGGTMLTGGKGGVAQTVLGVLFIGFMTNGLNLLGVQTFVQRVIIGVVVIVSVLLAKLQAMRGTD